jgi:hypothetical protein
MVDSFSTISYFFRTYLLADRKDSVSTKCNGCGGVLPYFHT